jgi:phenylpropionate dioxygenase-like ring-hydroxylating dioxygenase large terminal subunit
VEEDVDTETLAKLPYDPHTWIEIPNAGPSSVDRKYGHVSALYPELSDFRRNPDLSWYCGADFMREEHAGLWSKVWTCAGRLADVKEPGSYFRYRLGTESIVVTRSLQGNVRAFFNVCQHRGRELVDHDFGNGAQFVCPFHSWRFDLEGRNTRVTDDDLFSEEALEGDLNLRPLKCETWGGFVFVNIDLDAEPLTDFLKDVPELMAAYDMENMHVVQDIVLALDCNWKVALEAFIEGYHTHSSHPQVLPVLDDYHEQTDVFGNGHSRMSTPLAIPSPRMKGDNLNIGLRMMLEDVGIDPDSFEGGASDVFPAILAAKRQPGFCNGLDYSRMTDSQIMSNWNYFVFPNMTLNCQPEGIISMRFLPHGKDPSKSYYHSVVIAPKMAEGYRPPAYIGIPDDADTSGRTRPKRKFTTTDNPQLGEVIDQDISNMEAVQRGLESQGLPGGMRFAEREMRLQVLHAEIQRYLDRAERAAR